MEEEKMKPLYQVKLSEKKIINRNKEMRNMIESVCTRQ